IGSRLSALGGVTWLSWEGLTAKAWSRKPDARLRKFQKRIGNLRAVVVGDAGGRAFHVFHQPLKVVAGVRDRDHADGGLVPQVRRVKFRNRDVEGGAQPVFHAAHHLPLVLERVGGFDAEFERERGDHEKQWAASRYSGRR